ELNDLDFDLTLTGFDDFVLGDIDDIEEHISSSESPEEFKEVGETELNHKCPKCGFEYDV
ncbi:MAG: hypothetical protein ACOYOV_17680, partial [Bacteroidales bacterium]